MLSVNLSRKEEEKLIAKEEIPVTQVSFVPFENTDNLMLSGDFSAVKADEISFTRKIDFIPSQSRDDLISTIIDNQLVNTKRDFEKLPDNPFLLNNLGLAYLNKGELREAERLFKQALKLKSDFELAALNLANIYQINRDYVSAMSIYNDLLKVSPQDVRVLVNVGNIYLKEKKLKEAKGVFRAILKSDVNNIVARNKLSIINLVEHEFNKAISELRKCINIRTDIPAIYNNLGIAYALSGSYSKAIESFKIALKIYPNYASAVKNLAQALKHENEIDAAIELLEKYLITNESAPIRELLSILNYEMGKYQKALTNLKKVLELVEKKHAPLQEIARLNNNLGVICHEMGDYQNAESQYLSCIDKVGYYNHIIIENMIDLYFRTGRPEKEKELIQIFRDKFKGNDLYFYYFGRFVFYRGEIKESFKNLTIFLERNKRFVPAYALLSTIYTEFIQDYEKAIALNTEGLKIFPKDYCMINNLAYSYLMNNNIKNAELILALAKENTDNVFLNATRGLLAIKKGDLEEGRRLYNLAAKLADYNEKLMEEVIQKKHLELAKYFLSVGQKELATNNFKRVFGTKFQNTYYALQAAKLYSDYFNLQIE